MTTDPLQRFLRLASYVHAVAGNVLAVCVAGFLLSTFAVTVFQVDGISMHPTYQDGQVLGVNLLAYSGERQPKTGDIVIVQYEADRSVRFVKRVTAGPGDAVTYKGESIRLADGQYFVEGDNRAHSTDSRNYGPVAEERIAGRVAFALPGLDDLRRQLSEGWERFGGAR